MDEATLQRIVGIVKTMQSSGMGEKEITDNLRQMGVADEELEGILSGSGIAKPPAPEPVIAPPVADELHAKQDDMKASLSGLDDIKRELQGIKAEVADIKPQLGALKRINENLIEINKKMLARLGTK